MKCWNCENNIPESSKFCEYCGKDVSPNKESKIPIQKGISHTVDSELQISNSSKKGFFNRRVGRKAYLLTSILTSVAGGLASESSSTTDNNIIVGVSIIYILFLLVWIVITLWRLNDLGRSKWYFLLLLIPIVNIIIGFELCFSKGILHRSLTVISKQSDLPYCPNCGRSFSSNKVKCPYCKISLT